MEQFAPFTQQVAIRNVYLCVKRYQREYGTEYTRELLKKALAKLADESIRKPVITETQKMEMRMACRDSIEHLRLDLESEFGIDAVLTLHRYLVLANTSRGELLLMTHSKETLLRGVALVLLQESGEG